MGPCWGPIPCLALGWWMMEDTEDGKDVSLTMGGLESSWGHRFHRHEGTRERTVSIRIWLLSAKESQRMHDGRLPRGSETYGIPRIWGAIWFSSVQSFSRVQLFVTPWIAACQASLSITNSWSSLKPTSIESVMPSSHLILCHPLLLLPYSLPAQSFPMSQLFVSGGQSTGVSASASFLPKKSQGWSPLEWTSWISLQPKRLSRVFSNTTFKSINSLALSFLHSPTLTSIHDHRKNHSLD